MKITGTVIAVLVGILLIAGLLVGGYQLGWWLKENAVNRNTKISNDSLARQQALLEDANRKYVDVSNIDVQLTQAPSPQLMAQRKAIVNQFCVSYEGLTGKLQVSQNLQAFALKEC